MRFVQLVEDKYLVIEGKLWSGDVETKWEPKEGFFKQRKTVVGT